MQVGRLRPLRRIKCPRPVLVFRVRVFAVDIGQLDALARHRRRLARGLGCLRLGFGSVRHLTLKYLRWLRIVATAFIETFRGTPLLLQLFMVYYGLALMDFPLDPWVAVAIGFTLNASAFLGEIWRGSIEAVPKGQAEAAKAEDCP